MLLFCFVEGRAEATAFCIGFRKARLDLAELRARRGQGVLAFRQPPRQPCCFVESLIDRNLQRPLLVVEQRQLLARSRELPLQLYDALFGGIELLLQ